MNTYILGITGASGSVYGIRLLEQLLLLGHEVYVVLSRSGKAVAAYELGIGEITEQRDFLEAALAAIHTKFDFSNGVSCCDEGNFRDFLKPLKLRDQDDFFAEIASGSFKTAGMVIAPCSMNTLGCIANGVNLHLIHRAAEVQMKERRNLILLTREAPYSAIHLENMLTVTRAGGVVIPASPHFYANFSEDVKITSGDLIDSVITKILDQLSVEHDLPYRWS
ncbi:MAG: UbiX family flavin prenyltransferase [Thermoguttaceae bacterium]